MSEEISDENEKQVPSVSKAAGKTWVWWVVGLFVVFVLAGIGVPVGGCPRGSDREQAIMNIRQFGLALFSFEGDYGSYPNEATIAEVKKIEGVDLSVPLGTKSSNDFFRQLIVAGYLDQEGPFWAKGPNTHKPDGDIAGAKMLEAGECGFSYVVCESPKNVLKDAPLVMTPLIPGKRQFDYKTAKEYFAKKMIVLHRDNSISTHEIDKNGRVMIDGKDFFDPSQPYWGGKTPRIVWPE